MKFIDTLFNRKYSTVVCILLAVFNRIINVMFVSFAGKDKMILVLQSKSLLEGHGLSRPFYYFSDPDNPVWNFTPRWPPGYPVVLAPFLKLFNYDVYWATTTLDIAVCIALIFIVRKICMQIGFSKAATNIATVIAGAFEYTFIHESLPTDTISLVFLLIGIILTLSCMRSEYSFQRLLLAGFFLFSPCLFRYSYPPVTIAVPLVILLTGWLKKDRLLVKKGAGLLITTAVFVSILFLLIKASTGEASFILETKRGIYPENLTSWFPVIPSSFINIAFLTSQLIHKTGTSFTESMLWLEIISAIATLLLIILFFYLLKKKFFAVLTSFKWFLLIGFIVSAAIAVPLAYLSFTYHIQQSYYGSAGWNYVSEGRYFAFINIFLQLAFLGWVTLYHNSIKNIFLKIIAFSAGIFLFIDVAHNIYFHTKVALDYKAHKSVVFREQDYNYFDKLIPQLEKEYPGYDIMAAAPDDNYYYHMASYLGHKGVEDATPLKLGQPIVKKPSLLLLMLFDNELEDYKKTIEGDNVIFLKEIHISNFYLIKLEP